MIAKTARKPSSDPVQEKLRQDKATWNVQVSKFIDDVKHIKKMMNGFPSKFYKVRSRIIDPIPANPAAIIDSLAGRFQELAQSGQSIVEEQLTYSKTHRKPNIKPSVSDEGKPVEITPLTAINPPPLDLTKQLSAWEEKYVYELKTEGSNPITRTYTRMKNWPGTIGFSEKVRVRQLRMTLLKACAETNKELKKLQKEIVKSSKISAESSHHLMTKVAKQWLVVTANFKPYYEEKMGKGSLGPEKSEEGQEGQETQEGESEVDGKKEISPLDLPLYQMDRVKSILSDFRNNRQFFGNKISKELDALIDKINASPNSKRVDVALNSNLETIYTGALVALNSSLGTNGNSFKEIAVQLRKGIKPPTAPIVPTAVTSVVPPVTTTVASPENELMAEGTPLKWLGKLRHGLLPGSTSGRRLEIYRTIGDLRKALNVIMNLLEKGLDLEELRDNIIPFDREIIALRKLVRSLYTSEYPNKSVPMGFF